MINFLKYWFDLTATLTTILVIVISWVLMFSIPVTVLALGPLILTLVFWNPLFLLLYVGELAVIGLVAAIILDNRY